MSKLTDFYVGKSADDKGRMLKDIHAFDESRLEAVHDYIQWLFPLREPSRFNGNAPLLSDADIAAFRADPLLQAALRRSFHIMAAFYGFESDGQSLKRAGDFQRHAANWLNPGNHNMMRITRILRSMRLLGLESEAWSFLQALEELYREEGAAIGATTLGFWQKAVS